MTCKRTSYISRLLMPLLIFSCVAGLANAQSRSSKQASGRQKIKVEKPDLEKIEDETLDPHSRFYFPKLLAKYNRNDTIMTPEEFKYFYLGYMFQEDYDPYRVSPYSTVTDDLRLKATHTKEELDTIQKYAEKALDDNPFDLRQMSFLVHVYKEKNKNMSAKIWEFRLENLLGAIKSTGTGEDTENAWYVIYPSHEYDMVSLLGYNAVDVEYPAEGFDRLIVQPDPTAARKPRDNKRGFYFNVGMPTEQYVLKHPEDSDDDEEEVITDSSTTITGQAAEDFDPDEAPADE